MSRERVPDVGTFPLYAGDAWSQEFRMRIKSGDTLIDEPLGAYTDWACQWRKNSVAEASVDLAVTVDGSTLTLTVTPEQTRIIGTGVFDVQAVGPEGPRTFLRGGLRVIWDVTRGGTP